MGLRDKTSSCSNSGSPKDNQTMIKKDQDQYY